MNPLNSSSSDDKIRDNSVPVVEESDEAYRRRVYGTEGAEGATRTILDEKQTSGSALRRASRQFSREFGRRRSSVVESLPETPQGWAVLASVAASAALAYEMKVQKSLTCPPIVYGQVKGGPMKAIYDSLIATPESILRRPIQPSLFVGTRAMVASTAAYLLGGPSLKEHICFREVMTMTFDGGRLAIDWELPALETNKTTEERKKQVLEGPIDRPVVLILHGINNHANFGYIRSFARACSDRGWVAAAMNMRGCGGVKAATPRAYNGAFTGDIRCVIQILSSRLAKNVPVFLVGNSLSANLVTKYLGEEGLCGTLPDCVAGGAALGNPMLLKSSTLDKLFSPLLALGAKKIILENWSSFRHMTDPYSRSVVRKALMAVTLAEFDEALASVFARNDPIAPFGFRIGFKDGPAYWNDASAYRLVRFIPVPVLQLIAADDFLVYKQFQSKLGYSLANPNVMVVETKCGGHLGWQEAPPDGGSSFGKSWADVATADFIEAVIQTLSLRDGKKNSDVDPYFNKEAAQANSSRLRSRL